MVKNGDRPYFKGVASGSKHACGWSMLTSDGVCSRAIVFEGPLDAIAYYQMNKKSLQKEPALLVSLGGVEKLQVMATAINEHLAPTGGHLQKLDLAFDNDVAGVNAILGLQKKGLHSTANTKVCVLVPVRGKDWNDQLLKDVIGEKRVAIEAFNSSDLNEIQADKKNVSSVSKKEFENENAQFKDKDVWPKIENLEKFITNNRPLFTRFSVKEILEIENQTTITDRKILLTRSELNHLGFYPKNDVSKIELSDDSELRKKKLFTLENFRNYDLKGKNEDVRNIVNVRYNKMIRGWSHGRQEAYVQYRQALLSVPQPSKSQYKGLVEIAGQHIARTNLGLSAKEAASDFHFSSKQSAGVAWSELSLVDKMKMLNEICTYSRALVDTTKENISHLEKAKNIDFQKKTISR